MNKDVKNIIDTNQHGLLFHGSRKLFSEIMPHKGRNPKGGKNDNQFGVYSTPNVILAVVYAMSVRRSSFFKPKIKIIHLSGDKVKAVFKNCYLAHKPGYIYVFPMEEFICNNENEYFTSKSIRYDKCLFVTVDDFMEIIDRYIVLEEDLPPNSTLYRITLDWVDSFTFFFSYIKHFFYKTYNSIRRDSNN